VLTKPKLNLLSSLFSHISDAVPQDPSKTFLLNFKTEGEKNARAVQRCTQAVLRVSSVSASVHLSTHTHTRAHATPKFSLSLCLSVCLSFKGTSTYVKLEPMEHLLFRGLFLQIFLHFKFYVLYKTETTVNLWSLLTYTHWYRSGKRFDLKKVRSDSKI
jgi:hypothetical protein